MSKPTQHYYKDKDGNECGPLDLESLRQLLQARVINQHTSIKVGDGDQQWKALAQSIPELFNQDKQQPSQPTESSTVTTDTWRVNLGNLFTRDSKTGLIRSGTISIQDGLLLVKAWKPFPFKVRLIAGFLVFLPLAVWLSFKWVSYMNDAEWVAKLIGGIARLTENMSDELSWSISVIPVYIIPFLLVFTLTLFFPVSILMAAPASETFSPTTKPKRRGKKVSLKLKPQTKGAARKCFLRFGSDSDAEDFVSRFRS